MTDSTNNDTPEGEETSSADHDAAVAATSVEEHDEHQSLVEHNSVDVAAGESDAWQQEWDAAGGGDLDDAKQDSGIEPRVIAPSALRGHSHDTGPQDIEPVPTGSEDGSVVPPALVEPPRLSLRGTQRPDLDDTAPFEGLGSVGGDADVAKSDGVVSSIKEDTKAADDELAATQAMPVAREPEFEVAEEAVPAAVGAAAAGAATTKAATIEVDDETARAAATGTPIVLVETPTPPRKKGARGVGFVVVLLSTIVFGALLVGGIIGVGYLFDRNFSLDATLQSFWMQPSWMLPVIVFFLAYWIMTLIVNRAGWWAHVLGGFIVALVTYAAQLAGAFLETRESQWDFAALMQITLDDIAPLVLAPLAVVTFLLAREVPIWLGGIMARRGRKAREFNKTAIEDFERENAERLAEYEASRA